MIMPALSSKQQRMPLKKCEVVSEIVTINYIYIIMDTIHDFWFYSGSTYSMEVCNIYSVCIDTFARMDLCNTEDMFSAWISPVPMSWPDQELIFNLFSNSSVCFIYEHDSKGLLLTMMMRRMLMLMRRTTLTVMSNDSCRVPRINHSGLLQFHHPKVPNLKALHCTKWPSDPPNFLQF